jgi:hypothetical protein
LYIQTLNLISIKKKDISMFKVNHVTLIVLSGCVWLVAGCFLLPLGFNFIIASLLKENAAQPHPILGFLSSYTGGLDNAALIWIAFSLCVGLLKGRSVFAKSVNRSVNRILTLPNPTSLSKIYSPTYYLLLGSMILLSAVIRLTPLDVRGGIDIAVGSALIYGAVLYFRQAWQVRLTA